MVVFYYSLLIKIASLRALQPTAAKRRILDGTVSAAKKQQQQHTPSVPVDGENAVTPANDEAVTAVGGMNRTITSFFAKQ